MKRTILLFLSCLLFPSQNGLAQTTSRNIPEDTLAMVDSWPVTSRDLFERLELMLFEEKLEDHDFESVKSKAVESLVGEKLLSLSFKDSEAPDLWRFERVGRVLEKLLVRDELYKREIRDRAELGKSEVWEAVRRYAIKRRLLMVPCASPLEASSLSRTWSARRIAGESDSLILASLKRQADTVLIGFGSADTALESAAYALKDVRPAPSAVRTVLYGNAVIALLNDVPNPDAADKSPAAKEEAAKQILRERKEFTLASRFLDTILRGKRMEADTSVFREVVRRCWQLVTSDSVSRRVPKGFRFTQNDVYELMGEFKAKLDTPVVRGTFGEVSLGDFLENLMYYDFAIPSLKPRSFTVSFFEILRTITEAEMIAQEGYRRGYQNSAAVLADKEKWMGYWKSRYAEFAVVDTAQMRAWEPLWSLWRHHTEFVEKSAAFRVQEVLRPDSLSAAAILPLFAGGRNIDSIARGESIRKEWARTGGKSGWFKFNDHREIAGHALEVNVGDVAGPVRLKEGYSVFRLLDRKFEGDTTGLSRLLDQETRRMKMVHQQNAIDHYVAQEALSHRVEIFYQRIKEADIANVNMVTRRMIGFGGRMNAAPSLIPQWEWVKEWERVRNIFQ